MLQVHPKQKRAGIHTDAAKSQSAIGRCSFSIHAQVDLADAAADLFCRKPLISQVMDPVVYIRS